MLLKDKIFKELAKNGYSEEKGKKVWNIANRSFLYFTKPLAESFLKLRTHPRYRTAVVDIEISLIKEYAQKFLEGIKNGNFSMIDLGCGDGIKSKAFFSSIKTDSKIRFCPVSVNPYLIDLALKNVKKEKFSFIKEYISLNNAESYISSI